MKYAVKASMNELHALPGASDFSMNSDIGCRWLQAERPRPSLRWRIVMFA